MFEISVFTKFMKVNRIYEATCDETSQINKSYVKE